MEMDQQERESEMGDESPAMSTDQENELVNHPSANGVANGHPHRLNGGLNGHLHMNGGNYEQDVNMNKMTNNPINENAMNGHDMPNGVNGNAIPQTQIAENILRNGVHPAMAAALYSMYVGMQQQNGGQNENGQKIPAIPPNFPGFLVPQVPSQERELHDIKEESQSPTHEEEMSENEGDSGREPEDLDSCDDMRRASLIAAGHGDVISKLKMQVQDIKCDEDFDSSRPLNYPQFTNKNMQLPDGYPLSAPFPFSHPGATFLPPMPPQQAAPSSGSSHSSEGSASSHHTWSFEEQFKQVRQLYEINDDPKRKEFLDDLFSFMQKIGKPINRLPIMAKSVLDLYELYKLVVARGGLVDVINKKLWQEIIKGLHLPSSITSAAFTLRTQYMKYLYPYEYDKLKLSTPAELQAAIDGNRREGRRSSYGQYEQVARSPNHPQMTSLALASQQQQLAARVNSVINGMALHNGAHHPSHPQPMGQPINGNPLPGLAASEFNASVMEYMKMINKEIGTMVTPAPRHNENTSAQSAMHPFDRLSLWSLYNNPQSQPVVEPQREALNLSEPTVQTSTASGISNTRKRVPSTESPPPSKKFVKEETKEEAASPKPQNSTKLKISSRSDERNGDTTLEVSMELNGVTYAGVLFAQTAPPNGNRC